MKNFEHGGNIHKSRRDPSSSSSRILDFSANINPLGPPEWLRGLISRQIEELIHYPDPENTDFIKAVAEFTSLTEQNILVGNGTTELLYLIIRAVEAQRIVIPVPSYVDYVRAAELTGATKIFIELAEKEDFELNTDELSRKIAPGDLVIIGTPNNPTGNFPDQQILLNFIKAFPDTTFLLDEAFIDFIENASSLAGKSANIITMNSMTKFFGVPGLRIGYATASAERVKMVKNIQPPWTVNTLAQAVGRQALLDTSYQSLSRKTCRQLREELFNSLRKISGLHIYNGAANYLFGKLTNGKTSQQLYDHCFEQGIMIRRCDNYIGLDDRFFRIAVRSAEENEQLLKNFNDFFSEGKNVWRKTKRTPAIMFQGTCSNAGKSILTAALCRVLCQDGVRVAPFKAQNMSLNSFVTLQGDEMGRAQVVQAQAAKLDPDCRMNPILLKPNSDTGSQIIVKGKPVGNMSVLEYNDFKPKVWTSVCGCYDSLASEYEAIVLEGAGSPGEVNLKADDIVNMRMAQYAEAPVLIVGDIDRGGVYSSFVGIMEVLAEWERRLIAGFIVNKFRGQESLLQSAHDYVEFHTGKPVFGVLPHITNLGLPEEDSVSFKKGSFNTMKKADSIDVVLVSTPHISNFTDVEPLLEEPDVTLRVVERSSDVGFPHVIILPGSKNVIHDMKFLRDEGFAEIIKENIERGCEIVGICGGYQMLGRVIHDPHAIESNDGSLTGLGFLPMETIIEKEKRLTRKSGIHKASGKEVFGYEIHHGVSSKSEVPLIEFADGTSCGVADPHLPIWGSYLHGVFDSDTFRRWFIDSIRTKNGMTASGKILFRYDLEKEFARLATIFRAGVDMDAIYKMMKL